MLASTGFVAEIAAIIAWFAIVFTGKYPEGLYNFTAGYLRMISRTNRFSICSTTSGRRSAGRMLPDYPVRVGVPPPLDGVRPPEDWAAPDHRHPGMFLAIVQSIILAVCALIAWFVILFTGKLPEGLFNPMRSAIAYLTRGTGYFLLLTEDYPPFSYEEGGGRAPAGQISSEAASRES